MSNNLWAQSHDIVMFAQGKLMGGKSNFSSLSSEEKTLVALAVFGCRAALFFSPAVRCGVYIIIGKLYATIGIFC